MSWRRPWEPVVLFAMAVVLPLTAVGWLAAERRSADAVASTNVPHGQALASTREDRALSAERWFELALRAPRSFRKAVHWCERRREAPLPNCRNVAVADRVCDALGSVELARLGDG